MSDPTTPTPPKFVGARVNRVDGRLKVTGKADYTADYKFPDQAWAFVVKSTIAKGTVTNLDTSAAEKAPGIVKIYTPANRPKVYPPKSEHSGGLIVGEQLPPLANNGVVYYGQDLAYVIAESYEQARAAAGLIKITYDTEEPVADKAAAKMETPPKVNGEKTNLIKSASMMTSVSDVWNASPVKVDVTYSTPTIHHHPMEPHAVVAKWDGDRLTFYTPTQWMYGTRNFLAQSLAIPKEHVRVISHFVGGGFGCKGGSWMYMLMVAAAAHDLQRPVKFVMERENMFTSNGYRPATTQHLQLGADSSGKLQAVRHLSETSGCMVNDFIEPAGHAASSVLYASPNIEIDHHLYRLDLNGPTFMRAPGESPGIYALESAMDELATTLKMDPVQLRLANMTMNHPITGLPFSSRNLEECYRVGMQSFGWASRPTKPKTVTDGDWLVGTGMATASYPAHRSPAQARVRLLADGTAEVDCASQDLGTGTYTIMTQVAADELGLPIEKIKARLGDSTQPEAPVSGGSQSAASILPAVQAACRSAIEQLAGLAVADSGSPLHGLKTDDITAWNGALTAKSDPSKQQMITDIIAKAGKGVIEATEGVDPASEKKDPRSQSLFSWNSHAYQSFGAFFVEVRVHKLTCETHVSRLTAIMDIGQPLNLKTARSQIMGGATFGIGAALTEHSILDPKTGQWITQDLGTYHVPVNADVPEMDIQFVGPPDYQFNSLGARGVGEIGNTGIAAAIGNAVYHAAGVRIRELPITPEKSWRLVSVKELFELIEVRRQESGTPHAVATVLRLEGSSYRRPGARMLMNIHGRVAGSISGGCLEKAVISEGRCALIDGRPRLLVYDTTDQDDLALGASLGCQGKIWIGLEVLPANSVWPLEAVVDEICRRRKFAALITRTCGENECPRFESRLIFEDESDAADASAQEVLLHHKTSFQRTRDGVDSLIEFLAPPLSLLLFGAGPDVLPMIRLARQLGHEVTVIDRRSEFARAEFFPEATQVLAAPPHQLRSVLKCDDQTVAVLMNHHYDTDREVLAALIPLGLPYLAMLGPKKRTVRILEELREEGHDVGAVADTLHGPAGLDIGAESPEQIALAILAEIQATLSCRSGGKLRQRKAPIHSDAFTQAEPPCAVLA